MVRLEEVKRGFVFRPRRCVFERAFAWAARFRCLAKDYERLSKTVPGLHFHTQSLCSVARIDPGPFRKVRFTLSTFGAERFPPLGLRRLNRICTHWHSRIPTTQFSIQFVRCGSFVQCYPFGVVV